MNVSVDTKNKIIKIAENLFYPNENYDFRDEINKIFNYTQLTPTEQKLVNLVKEENISLEQLVQIIGDNHQKNQLEKQYTEYLKNNDFLKLEEILKNNNLNAKCKQEIFQKKYRFIENLKNKYIINAPRENIQADIDKLPNKNLEKFLDFIDAVDKLKTYLQQFEFNKSDLCNKDITTISHEFYSKLKAKYVKDYFFNKKGIEINEEQALAIAIPTQNVLVAARAGSGKTRTIACRTILAIEKDNIKSDEILLLSFNHNAANEMRSRIYQDFKYKNFNKKSARTFHSLAWDIVNPTEELIYDDGEKETKQKLTKFVWSIYSSKKVFTKKFKEDLLEFYKWSPEKNEDLDSAYWIFRNDNEKYQILRTKKFVTLNREKVKSNGEKWIADFLFEHNISYKYEELLACEYINSEEKQRKKRCLYHPDFTIWVKETGTKYIIEHWGIDEKNKEKVTPSYWSKSYDEYYNEMLWKRKIIEKKSKFEKIKLIETSVCDLTKGRKHFEHILKSRLEENGLSCIKLSTEAIIQKIDNNYIDEMAKKFAQFILYAQKVKITPEEIKRKLNNNIFGENKRCKLFVEMANNVYQEYQEELINKNKIDFDNVIVKATQTIIETKGECTITLDNKLQKIKNLKMILIDEYQDFSQLFFDMITAIIQYNPSIKLFCVGDDWQAINSFAGSELKFFKNFNQKFNNSAITYLTYNYRSAKEIVSAGNSLMAGFGNPCKFISKDKGAIKLFYIDDIDIIKCQNDFKFINSFDNKFVGLFERYFYKCVEIISKNINQSYFIMHRETNISEYKKIQTFKEKLNKYFNNKVNLNVDTIHKFKGMEADSIIILEVTENKIPLMHPDGEFYLIFDKTVQNTFDEERRLFYVALTRAKSNIYILTERNKISPFIAQIKHFV